MRTSLLLACLLTVPVTRPAAGAAQEPDGPKPVQTARPLALPTFRPPVADTGIFSPLPLPAAGITRAAGGTPGARYWQQRVDYTIKATLDTAAKRVTALESIQYTNHSPDTLRFLWLQLDQNLFRQGSTGSLLFAPGSRFDGAGFMGGFVIERVVQCLEPSRRPGATRRRRQTAPPAQLPPCPSVSLKSRVDGTMMYLELVRPIAPAGTALLEMSYSFNVPEHGAGRMGREGTLYQVAQWYPRLAVYDDVHGWNTDQYLGQGEFYLEYGDIDYEITLPAGYIVAGTGVLQNPGEVLTAAQQARLAAAAKSDSTTPIVTAAELSSGAARPALQSSLTWRFRARNVRDVAWAASPDYQWDASAWDGVLAHAFYRPSAADIWREAAGMTRSSIREYSARWLRYPYPQISTVEGPVAGMAYPMLAMGARGSSLADLYRMLTHEIGHMWYPMIVGSDERRHAWMDEGFNTFINTFSEEAYWKRDDSALRQRERELVLRTDQTPSAQPILTPANRYQNRDNLVSLASVKPSVMLLALRNKVLGAEVFDSAFREYTRRWSFKHPQPADFFRTIEQVSGRDLSWFWRGFFYTTAPLDQSIESVKQSPDGSAQITLANLGNAVMPVELELGLDDGSVQLIKLPVEIWYRGDRFLYELQPGRTIVRARVNPDGSLPDAVGANDAWQRPNSANTTAADERR